MKERVLLPEKDEPVLVQGITGKYGSLHTRLMLDYGTNVAAGITPGKAGEAVEGVPVYDTVREAVATTGARCSIVFVPAQRFYSAAEEAMRAGVKLLVAITERVPIRDELKLIALAEELGVTMIGPNTPGLIVPEPRFKMGIMPAPCFRPGRIALFSRSGTLMYEVANQISSQGFGQCVALGVGGDPLNGTTLEDCFDWAEDAEAVDAVVAVGEIGGGAEEALAKHITQGAITKPVFAYIAGRSAPKEKKMGHAGAIIYGDYGTAESKITALRDAGARVAMTPMEVPALLKRYL